MEQITRKEVETVLAHWKQVAEQSNAIPALRENALKNAEIAELALNYMDLCK